MTHFDILDIIAIAREAGRRIMEVYAEETIEVSEKSDHSLLTKADMLSHHFICDALNQLYPTIPVISEESADKHTYAERQKWDAYFLVDPLDGTKEFIKKNGEFTINIALMKKNEPYLGVIFAPALDLLYFAEKNKGAFKIKQNEKLKLPSSQSIHQTVRAVVSRSHLCSGTANFLEVLKREGKIIEKVSIGSALKFGLVAEGLADIYPRFTPSMEWDTAAGDLLVTEVGKAIFRVTDGLPLEYNTLTLIHPGFIVRDTPH